MKVSVKGYIYHKQSEQFNDCFDRYGVNTSNNKFAIADGVSKSFFPGIWAELLIKNFIKIPGKIDLNNTEIIESSQFEWDQRVEDIVNKPNQKFFVKNMHAQGRSAAATFVGLSFFKEKNFFKWEAIALGDSFLFFVPENKDAILTDIEKISYLSSKKNLEFNNFPDFFDSRSKLNKGKIKQRKGELKPGTFFLVTDALAEWFISDPIFALSEISLWTNQTDFENSIASLRKKTLQNDDSAILIIKVENDSSSDFFYDSINISNIDDFILRENEIQKRSGDNVYPNESLPEVEKILLQSSKYDNHTEVANNEKNSKSDLEKKHSNEIGSNKIDLAETNLNHSKIKNRSKRTLWEIGVDTFYALLNIQRIPDDFISITLAPRENKKDDDSDIEMILKVNDEISTENKQDELSEKEKDEKKPLGEKRKRKNNKDRGDNDEDINSIANKF